MGTQWTQGSQAGTQGTQGVGGSGSGKAAMRWTPVMSSFVLRRFVDLVGGGVKTDKGFKEVHLNQVARSLSEFTGQEVSGNQVYNHLRKWRQRWVKVCRLKDLSGAIWDENSYSIILDDEYLLGHTKVSYPLLLFSLTPLLQFSLTGPMLIFSF